MNIINWHLKFAYIIALLITSSCHSKNENLLAKMRMQMRPVHDMRSKYVIADLAQMTSFPWDSVYFFNGEEGGDYVNRTIGFDWNGPFVPSLHKRLLFVGKKNIVNYIDFNEEKSILSHDESDYEMPIYVYRCHNRKGISRKEAKFVIFRVNEQGYTMFPMIPIDCLDKFPHYKSLFMK